MNVFLKNLWAVAQVAGCYVVIVFGQALWKLGINKIRVPDEPVSSFLWKYITSWYFLTGAAAYIVATAIWIYILSKYDFNLVYPMNSIGYIFAIFLSLVIFHESIPFNRYIGIIVIIFGIILLSIK